jgi:hypothetical protein
MFRKTVLPTSSGPKKKKQQKAVPSKSVADYTALLPRKLQTYNLHTPSHHLENLKSYTSATLC